MTDHLGLYRSEFGLEHHGINGAGAVYWNQPTPSLYEKSLLGGEGTLVHSGPLVVSTGEHTGRSPLDKFIVDEPSSRDAIWWGDVNRPISEEQFQRLYERMKDYVKGRDLFVFDGYAGADPAHRLPIRVITEHAWHSLFARNMFLREPDPKALRAHVPEFTVIDLPGFHADPEIDGTRSRTAIVVHFGKRLVLVGRTNYAGEIKKSIFTVMNYMLPDDAVLPMHCSANYGQDTNDVALFFGLSGTGKTTLSNVPDRTLIGDDEHGWSERGVFNMEGGCYAKVIRLDPEGEPLIYDAAHRFGTILENVAYDEATRRPDLHDNSITENTRASYPLSHLQNAAPQGVAGHPRNIVFLTADAFGVLPPISRLSVDQAMYHFLSGYTAKVAGTERGVDEPKPVFSACFGAPFMPLHPMRYAELLGERLRDHDTQAWLINTGWTAGPYGHGRRIALAHTRRMVSAVLAGELEKLDGMHEPYFGLEIPHRIDGVPSDILIPKETWDDPKAYDSQARKLLAMFTDNFAHFADAVSPEILAAGPSPT